MAPWQYAFFFPHDKTSLSGANAVADLASFGLEFDDSIRLCIRIDEEGHLLDVGEEIRLAPPVLASLIRHLGEGTSLSIQARSTEITVSCQFLTQAGNPHISLGWSRRMLENLREKTQRAFWSTIRQFARDCNAAYVIIVDDAPDHFEDRFIAIQGIRFLDMQVTHQYGLGIRSVWIRSALVGEPPEGPMYSGAAQIGDGFTAYSVGDNSLGEEWGQRCWPRRATCFS